MVIFGPSSDHQSLKNVESASATTKKKMSFIRASLNPGPPSAHEQLKHSDIDISQDRNFILDVIVIRKPLSP